MRQKKRWNFNGFFTFKYICGKSAVFSESLPIRRRHVKQRKHGNRWKTQSLRLAMWIYHKASVFSDWEDVAAVTHAVKMLIRLEFCEYIPFVVYTWTISLCPIIPSVSSNSKFVQWRQLILRLFWLITRNQFSNESELLVREVFFLRVWSRGRGRRMSLDDQASRQPWKRSRSYHVDVGRRHECSSSYIIRTFDFSRNGEKGAHMISLITNASHVMAAVTHLFV